MREVLLADGKVNVSGITLEVVQNHRDDQVQHDEAADEDEEDKVDDGADVRRRAPVFVPFFSQAQFVQQRIVLVHVSAGVRPDLYLVALSVHHAVVHDPVPHLSG